MNHIKGNKNKKSLTPNIDLKSGSLNLNGIFDTCNLFGWFFESEEEMVAIVVVDVVIGTTDVNAVVVDELGRVATDDAVVLVSTDCDVSGSEDCCNKLDCTNLH